MSELAGIPTSVIDLERLARWMDERGLGSGPLVDPVVLTGGTQNVLVRFTRGDRSYVLRRPPPHKRANSDSTMQREARMLGALSGTDVPHPGFIAACDDLDVIGACFYLMEPVEGFNPSTGLPPSYASNLHWQREMGLSMADGIAALGRVDHVAVGLGDFGKADGWLERQVERWRSHLAGYSAIDGYAGPDLPDVEGVASWLDAGRPATWTPGIIHGDFHFANVLMRFDHPVLAAIVDWELCTIGDPLLDLGHLLATWPDPDVAGAAAIGLHAPGLPSADEVIARYAGGSTRSVADARWYTVLACYRLGIILEGTNARADAGLAPREIGDRLHATTVGLLEKAHRLMGG